MPTDLDPDLTIQAEAHVLRRVAIITAASGIAHAVLLVMAFVLIRRNSPAVNASESDILEFIGDESRRRMVRIGGVYLVPFAGIAYIWFVVSLRAWLSRSVNRLTPLLANLLLVCGVAYVVLFFAAGAALSVISFDFSSDTVANVTGISTLYWQFPRFGTVLLFVFAMRMAAMMVFAISTISRSSGLFPRWFWLSGYLVGLLLLLTSSLSPLIVLIFPVWLTVFCVLVIIGARRRDDREMAEALESHLANPVVAGVAGEAMR